MNLQIAPARSTSQGFSLVELMIAIVIGLIVILGASSVFLSSKQSYRTSSALNQIQDGTRIAFELLARDLRQARLTGCGNQNTVNNRITGTPWYSDITDNGLRGYDSTTAAAPELIVGTASSNQVAGTESLAIVGAGDVSYGLGATYVATTGLQITEANPQFSIGDLIVVCDPQQADIVQITGNNGGNFQVAVGSGTPGNATAINRIYDVNALASSLKSVIWYIGCNPAVELACDPLRGGTSLYRLIVVGVAASTSITTQRQEMVRGVAALGFRYHTTGAADFVEAGAVASWAPTAIDAVRINARLVAMDRTGGAETPIFRDMATTVTLRNPPLN